MILCLPSVDLLQQRRQAPQVQALRLPPAARLRVDLERSGSAEVCRLCLADRVALRRVAHLPRGAAAVTMIAAETFQTRTKNVIANVKGTGGSGIATGNQLATGTLHNAGHEVGVVDGDNGLTTLLDEFFR